LPTLTREERADKVKVLISTRFNTKQQVFIEFVRSQYVKVGVEELDREKLSPLLKLKYNNAIADAVADLGRPEEIGNVRASRHLLVEVPLETGEKPSIDPVNDAKLVSSEFHALVSFIVFKLHSIGRKNPVLQIEQQAYGVVPNVLIEPFSSR
jgi:hypothetical protein